MAHTACKLLWLKNLLTEFGFKLKYPTTMYCDNQSAIYTIKNLLFHDRTKYIKVDYHLVQDVMMKKVICIPFNPSSEQLTDILTKAASPTVFSSL